MNVLIVDDEQDIRETLEMVLSYQGYEISQAESASAAIQRLEEGPLPEVCLMDVKMPGRDGLDLLAEVRDRWPSVAVVMISGHGDAHMVSRRPAGEPTSSSRSRSPRSACS